MVFSVVMQPLLKTNIYIYIYIYVYGTPPPRTYLQTCSVYMYATTLLHMHTHTHTRAHTHVTWINVYEHCYIIRKGLGMQDHAQQNSLEARLH